MQQIIKAVASSVIVGNWQGGLNSALTIPDICGRLENPKSGVGERYVRWWNSYVLHKYKGFVGALPQQEEVFLSGEDCYALRCAVLHEGRSDITEQKKRDVLDRIHFFAPGSWVDMHCNRVNDRLFLRVDFFCRDIVKGAQAWMVAMAGRKEVEQRMAELMVVERSGPVFIDGAGNIQREMCRPD